MKFPSFLYSYEDKKDNCTKILLYEIQRKMETSLYCFDTGLFSHATKLFSLLFKDTLTFNMEYDNYDDMYDEDMLQDMMAQYGDYEFDDVEEYGRIPFKELINNCVIPTLSQASQSLFPIYLMCFVFKSTLYLGGSGKSFICFN